MNDEGRPTRRHRRPELREKLLGIGRLVLERGALPLALVMAPLLYQREVAKDAEKARQDASKLAEQARADADRLARREQSYRLYTELINRREEADTALRRELFTRLMGNYLDPKARNIDQRLVALEMLSLNFHDTLHLSPLFAEVDDLITAEPLPRRQRLLTELDRIVQQVKVRQAATLEIDGAKHEWAIQLTDLYDGAPPLTERFALRRPGQDANAPAAERGFVVDVISHDPHGRRLYVVVSSPDDGFDRPLGFWVDPYDLPLLSFGRLSPTERFAVLLDHYDATIGFAILRLIYFPSTRSGAKDRPYVDDLINRLLPADVAAVEAQRPAAQEPASAGPAASVAAGAAPASR